MKKQILLLLTTILSLNSYSQINFDKGYFINDSNQKVDCLIKNIDWKNNPTEFEYKLTNNSDTQKATIKTVKEFGIHNMSKYVRYSVKIDRSSDLINKMSNVKNSVFKEEELFLKVLIEGKANLYSFEDSNLKRYFYSLDNSNVEQLIFKQYINSDNQVGTNKKYKQQLWDNLKCSSFEMDKIKKMEYKKKELVSFFEEYNKCNNQEFIKYEEKQKRDLFNLSIRPGLNSSSLVIYNSSSSLRRTDYGNKMTFRIGLESEIVMGFNKNKWAILIEPTYQYYKAEEEPVTNLSNTNVDYKSIEVPVGLRHYFFLNKSSKIFINGSFISEIILDSKVRNLDVKSDVNFAMGLGYNYNNMYSVELRYQTNRDVLTNYILWNSEYKTISVIFGYTLF
ncbi:MAG: tRNA modification GTPase [Flavobacteriaceae bacterium]